MNCLADEIALRLTSRESGGFSVILIDSLTQFSFQYKMIPERAAPVAQRTEQLPSKQKVVGSSPAGGACFTKRQGLPVK